MKKTFFLIGALGLLTSAGIAHGSDERDWTEKIWNDDSAVENTTLGQNDKLIIQLGSTAENQEVDLGDSTITNNVVTGNNAAINNNTTPPDDPYASLLTYTYGALHLADDTNVKFSNSGNLEWSYVGTLSLGADARLHLAGRYFAVTGVPYVSMGAGAEIELSTTTSVDQGTGEQRRHLGLLSLSPSNQDHWDALTVKGAYGEPGYIRNTSDSVATLGTETAANVEYVNVILTVQGDEAQTPIVAKMSNAAIVNQSAANGSIVVSGGVAKADTTAVTQISTGLGTSRGGDVTLLNRGSSIQEMDAVLIGAHTVTARQGDNDSEAAVIRINAYDASKTYDVGGYDATPGLIVWEENASLDADLILGTGNTNDAVYFHNYSALDMCGNDVTLNSGILITDPGNYGEDIGTEVLLFTNVDSLTLGNITYDDKYFDYHAEIEAGRFFTSSTDTSATGLLTSVDMPTDNGDGTRTGWFIEYRETSTGIGNVYLVLNTVPEPTSATLSLLALAGLAARRRRK